MTTIRSVVRGMARRANPAFAAGSVAVPVAALVYAHTVAPLQHLAYVHVMAGVLWTGFDVGMGAVFGPVIGGLSDEEKAAVFERLTPKASFLIPTLALVSIATGIALVRRIGLMSDAAFGPWLALFTAANLVPGLLLIGWQFGAWQDRRWQLGFAVAALGSLAWLAATVGSLAPPTGGAALAVVVALGIVTVLAVQGFGLLLPGEVRIYREMTSEDRDEAVIAAIGQRNAKLAGVQGLFQIALIAVMVALRYGGF
mgnify:CR=1 FL=1